MAVLPDIMIDLETMDTIATACVISIGAVKFDHTTDEISDDGFYASVSLQSNLDYGRTISEDTTRWWMKQAAENPKSVQVFDEFKTGIDDALQNMADWIGQATPYRIWSNGANFDEPILAHAYTQCRQPIPWKFWDVRCVRTYKNLPGAKDVVVPRVGVHHNALADALTQAALVQAIHKKLFKGRGMRG